MPSLIQFKWIIFGTGKQKLSLLEVNDPGDDLEHLGVVHKNVAIVGFGFKLHTK